MCLSLGFLEDDIRQYIIYIYISNKRNHIGNRRRKMNSMKIQKKTQIKIKYNDKNAITCRNEHSASVSCRGKMDPRSCANCRHRTNQVLALKLRISSIGEHCLRIDAVWTPNAMTVRSAARSAHKLSVARKMWRDASVKTARVATVHCVECE